MRQASVSIQLQTAHMKCMSAPCGFGLQNSDPYFYLIPILGTRNNAKFGVHTCIPVTIKMYDKM
jgi:hypothetical protein